DSVMLFIRLRRMDEAAVKLERLGAVENFGHRYHLAQFYFRLAQSDSVRALQELDFLRSETSDESVLLPKYAFYYARTGERERALGCLRQLLAIRQGLSFKEDTIAGIHAVLGDVDEAFR